MNFSFWLWPALRALFLGALLTAISLPVLLWTHSHFELGAPPANGLRALGLGLMAAFVGATWIGLGLGRTRGLLSSGTMAALGGFIWGTLVVLSLSSFYSGLVSQVALRDANTIASQNRERMTQASGETIEQARAGHASRDAALAGVEFSDDARTVTIQGASKLPAMALLVWAILLSPALSALECRRTRRDD